jgi:hypothetical protein
MKVGVIITSSMSLYDRREERDALDAGDLRE